MQDSVKSQRLLQRLGVPAALERGETLVLVGPIYELRKQPAHFVQLAFVRDEEARLCVGYATRDGDTWELTEAEPFTMRALGYYERRLKRIGDFVHTTPTRKRR